MEVKQTKEEMELEEILLKENVNIWLGDQTFLEQQALNELEAFHKEQKEISRIDGNLERTNKQKENNNEEIISSPLNIETYLKKQEELKKRHDFQNSLNGEVKHLLREKHTRKKRKIVKVPCKSKHNYNNNEQTKEISTEVCYPQREEGTSGSEYIPSDQDYGSDDEYRDKKIKEVKLHKKKRKRCEEHVEKVVDDGIWQNYKSRLDLYYKRLQDEEEIFKKLDEGNSESVEYNMLKGGLKVQIDIWNKLYGYQQDAIKWLWKVHQKCTGGLLGDEMGLGKTVEVITFLHSLEYSRISSCHGRFIGVGPSLIVCPATVIYQWIQHFHDWAPEFRVVILHQSGSYQGNKAALIKDVHKTKGIIITTYLGIVKYQTHLLEYNWHYMILDEGHKIRNPNTKATVAIKLIRTPHRLMLTGSPMQNDLTELWSLFDFTNPGMLGNLKTFQEHFSGPILQGGFSNSTPMQEATALSVASTLKEIITPYLLRRTKNEVQHHILLPNKTEQVLFCSLSDEQKLLYKEYLMGDDVSHILGKGVKNWSADNHIRARVFVAITKLRKICNHPDIYLTAANNEVDQDTTCGNGSTSGYYKKSGKMLVVSALLKIWKKQSHRVLLFTQTRSMIDIFKNFLQEQGYKYLKMDGTTSISSRQTLIERFNMDSSYDVFLLTTRVGGLGVNLTGADRVIIYDPDWNPATDTQARERAWRIGQEKQVTIYRLLSAGTIEEKIYQRQIWKQLLSNKILLDPATNKFFKYSDLFDLFSLQESVDCNPETVNIFHNSRIRIQDKLREDAKKKRNKNSKESKVRFTEDKIIEMKNLAQQIAKSLNKTPTSLQIELEAEKKEKENERKEMKTLEVGELLKYNKERVKKKEDVHVNKIDDYEAVVGFSDALRYSEKTAKLHQNLQTSNAIIDKIVEKAKTAKCKITKEPDKLIDKFRKRKDKKTVDTSGRIEGQQVEGLVKMEIKRNKKKNRDDGTSEVQDDYILGKLFQKKGVSGAIQHDSVIQEGSQGRSLKIHSEAKMRAEKSLEALRKSRVDNWRW